MNEVPEELIFNWDQTALKFMATGQWTMNRAGEQIVMITNSDDKRQVMAVFAATLTGELQPPPPDHLQRKDSFCMQLTKAYRAETSCNQLID